MALVQDLRLVAEIAWSLGWIIAIPAALFGFAGAYADKSLGTTPLFILLGLGIAVTLSSIGLYRRLSDILRKEMPK